MYGSHSTKIHRKRYILIPAVICYNFKIDLTMSCNFYDYYYIYEAYIVIGNLNSDVSNGNLYSNHNEF